MLVNRILVDVDEGQTSAQVEAAAKHLTRLLPVEATSGETPEEMGAAVTPVTRRVLGEVTNHSGPRSTAGARPKPSLLATAEPTTAADLVDDVVA